MSKNIVLTVLIILILALGAWWLMAGREEAAPEELTEETALLVLGVECETEGVEDLYQACTLDITEGEEAWTTTVTYSGLFDDSLQAARIEAEMTLENGEWVLSGVSETVQCQPGRGHQDFSAELCV